MEKARFEKRLFSHEITHSSVRRQSVDIEYLLMITSWHSYCADLLD